MARTLVDEFLSSISMSLGVVEYRYGKFVAMIAHENALSDWLENINDENGESEYELWGLPLTHWFPIGYGDTVVEAIANLEPKLAETEEHWSILNTALRRLQPEPLTRSLQCSIKTISELVEENAHWEISEAESMLTQRPGFVIHVRN